MRFLLVVLALAFLLSLEPSSVSAQYRPVTSNRNRNSVGQHDDTPTPNRPRLPTNTIGASRTMNSAAARQLAAQRRANGQRASSQFRGAAQQKCPDCDQQQLHMTAKNLMDANSIEQARANPKTGALVDGKLNAKRSQVQFGQSGITLDKLVQASPLLRSSKAAIINEEQARAAYFAEASERFNKNCQTITCQQQSSSQKRAVIEKMAEEAINLDLRAASLIKTTNENIALSPNFKLNVPERIPQSQRAPLPELGGMSLFEFHQMAMKSLGAPIPNSVNEVKQFYANELRKRTNFDTFSNERQASDAAQRRLDSEIQQLKNPAFRGALTKNLPSETFLGFPSGLTYNDLLTAPGANWRKGNLGRLPENYQDLVQSYQDAAKAALKNTAKDRDQKAIEAKMQELARQDVEIIKKGKVQEDRANADFASLQRKAASRAAPLPGPYKGVSIDDIFNPKYGTKASEPWDFEPTARSAMTGQFIDSHYRALARKLGEPNWEKLRDDDVNRILARKTAGTDAELDSAPSTSSRRSHRSRVAVDVNVVVQ